VTSAYDDLAPVYDLLTADYDHGAWLAAIEREARELGLRGRTVLDVACGTGSSFLPLMSKGYDVTGCDNSAAMLAIAARKAPGVRLELADIRALPELGRFDLLLCLDDVLNHLLEADDLVRTFAGMRRNLAPDGIAVWDTNTLSMYGSSETAARVVSSGDPFVLWEVRVPEDLPAGGSVEVVTHAFSAGDGETWARRTAIVRQRHWPDVEIRRAAAAAGLAIRAVRGQTRGVTLHADADEDAHTKLLYFATPSAERERPERLERSGRQRGEEAVAAALGEPRDDQPGGRVVERRPGDLERAGEVVEVVAADRRRHRELEDDAPLMLVAGGVIRGDAVGPRNATVAMHGS
jgi:SAM-dependent methyltransferase